MTVSGFNELSSCFDFMYNFIQGVIEQSGEQADAVESGEQVDEEKTIPNLLFERATTPVLKVVLGVLFENSNKVKISKLTENYFQIDVCNPYTLQDHAWPDRAKHRFKITDGSMYLIFENEETICLWDSADPSYLTYKQCLVQKICTVGKNSFQLLNEEGLIETIYVGDLEHLKDVRNFFNG